MKMSLALYTVLTIALMVHTQRGGKTAGALAQRKEQWAAAPNGTDSHGNLSHHTHTHTHVQLKNKS